MTNNEDVYVKCDGYTDHGHDHKGVDRGADFILSLVIIFVSRIACSSWSCTNKKAG